MATEHDYLWDKTGSPDPDLARLEGLLRPYGHDGRPLRLERPSGRRPGWRQPTPWLAALAAAATIALSIGGVSLLRRTSDGWAVARLDGVPRIGSSAVTDRGRLPVGGWLETDAVSRAEVEVGKVGLVTVEPGSRVGLLQARPTDQRMALERGGIHAVIWAPPGLFQVATPAATAVDLGCVYTLEVDAEGSGLLRVQSGWVAFEHEGIESFVPKFAACRTRRGQGPGTPYYEDASPALIEALQVFDDATGDAGGRADALARVLAEARPRDALTLWHLLTRVAAGDRGSVFDRLAAVAPPPDGVTRDRVVAGERGAIDEWWDHLGLESTSWWRMWRQRWTDPRPPR